MTAINLPRVPEGLRDLMKAYTKEVLREKPKDLLGFSSHYFENIAAIRTRHNIIQYEPPQNYEIIMKNRIRQQVPLSLVHYIIPENLTDVVKNFIKAVLKENPENLLVFARHYFQKLRLSQAKIDYTKYAAYEKYIKENGKWSQESKVICTCGRILEEKTGQQSIKSFDRQIDKHNNNLRAVCIIQKHYRNYLKRKAESSAKVKLLTTDFYKSADYLNAISLIQRQFRRYLSKKRAKSTMILTSTSIERYNSVKYIKAIYIIQRQCRLYLAKKSLQRPPIKSGLLPLDTSVSITAAALIIQRAFRRMVKVAKDKRHTNAELEQSDDINDNASEAGSYTSASTALLSTESAGEHNELGGINYEEGVHQQTINEDEEVENEYKNLQKQHVTEAIKSSEKSIISNGNAAQDIMDQNSMEIKSLQTVLKGVNNQAKQHQLEATSDDSTAQDIMDQNSMEIKSLQTVLKGVNNQAKQHQFEATSDDSKSSIISTSLESTELDNIGTTIKIHSVLPTEGDYEIRLLPENNIEPVNTNRVMENTRDTSANGDQILREKIMETQKALKDDEDTVTQEYESLIVPEEQTVTNEQDLTGVATEKILRTDDDVIILKHDSKEVAKEDQPTIASSSNQPEIIPTPIQDTLQEKQRYSMESDIKAKAVLPAEDELEISLTAQNDSSSDSVIIKRSIRNEQDKPDHGGDLLIDISNEENIAGEKTQKAAKPEDEEVTIVPDSSTEQIIKSDSIDMSKEKDQQSLSSNPSEIIATLTQETNNQTIGSGTEVETIPILTQDTNNQTIGSGTEVETIPILTQDTNYQTIVSGTEEEIQSLLQAEDELEISLPSPDDSIITIRENKNENDTTENAEDVLSENISIDKIMTNNEDIAEVQAQKKSKPDSDEVTLVPDSPGENILTKVQDSVELVTDKILSHDSIEKSKEDQQTIAPFSNTSELIPTLTQDTLQEKQRNSIETEIKTQGVLPAEDKLERSFSVNTNNASKNVQDTPEDAKDTLSENKNIDKNITSEEDIAGAVTQNFSKPKDVQATLLRDSLNMPEEQTLSNEQDLIETVTEKILKTDDNVKILRIDSTDTSKEDNKQTIASSPSPTEIIPTSTQDTLQDKQSNVVGTEIKSQSIIPDEIELQKSLPSQDDIEKVITKRAIKNVDASPENAKQILSESISIDNNKPNDKNLSDLETQKGTEPVDGGDPLNIPGNKTLTNEQDLIEKVTEKMLKTDDNLKILRIDSIDTSKEDKKQIIASSESPTKIPPSTQDTLQDKQNNKVEIKSQSIIPDGTELEKSLPSQDDSEKVISKRAIKNVDASPENAKQILSESISIDKNITNDKNLSDLETQKGTKPDDGGVTLEHDPVIMTGEKTLNNEYDLIEIVTDKIIRTDDNVINLKKDTSKEDNKQIIALSASPTEIIPTSTEDTLQDKQSNVVGTEIKSQRIIPDGIELEKSLPSQDDIEKVITKRAIENVDASPENAKQILSESISIDKNKPNDKNLSDLETQKGTKPEDGSDPLNIPGKKTLTDEQEIMGLVIEKIVEAADDVINPKQGALEMVKEEEQKNIAATSSLSDIKDKNNTKNKEMEDKLKLSIKEDVDKIDLAGQVENNAEDVDTDLTTANPTSIDSGNLRELENPIVPSDTEILTSAEPSEEPKEIKIDLNTEHSNVLVSPLRSADSSEDHPKEIKIDASTSNERDKNKSIERENKKIKENDGSITRSSSLNAEVNSDNTKLMDIKEPDEDEPSKLEQIEQNLRQQPSEPTDEDDNKNMPKVISTSTEEAAIIEKSLIGNDLEIKESVQFESPISKSTKKGSTNEQISNADKQPIVTENEKTEKQNLESIDLKDGPSKKLIKRETTEVEIMDKILTNKSSEVKPDSSNPEMDKILTNKSSEVKTDSSSPENRSSTVLSKPPIGKQIITSSTNKSKKVHVAKDKQIPSNSSGRLINVPIAELQLKSFSDPTDTGLWYEVHMEPETSDADTKSHIKSKQNNEGLIEPIITAESGAGEILDKKVESNDEVQQKPSVSFFIPYDETNDGKKASKQPTKKNTKTAQNTSAQNDEENDGEEEAPQDSTAGQDELGEVATDFNYQEFGTQKLQTIHELNESEIATELRRNVQKSVQNVPEIQVELENENTENDYQESKIADAENESSVQNLNESSESNDQDGIKNVHTNLDDDQIKHMRSATIIQRAFKNYLARRRQGEPEIKESKESQKVETSNMAPNSETPLSENLAATKIQKAFRRFLTKTAPKSSEWFVGWQPIILESSERKAVETQIESSAASARINGTLETNLGTDIGNLENDIYPTKIFENDNGTSKNLAGSTNDVDIELDRALTRSESDSLPKEILMEFLNKEIDFSSGLEPHRLEEVPSAKKSDADASTRDIMKEFLMREIDFCSGIEEVPCIRKSISHTTLDQQDNADTETEKRKENNQEQSQIDTDLNLLENGALKLPEADEIVSAQLEKEDKEESPISEQIADETVVRPMSSVQEQTSLDIPDGDVIVYERLQRDESRESSAQSESVIFGNSDEDRIVSKEAETARTQLSRHYTIAGDDPQSIFRSVTIVDAVQFIENEDVDLATEVNSGNSFCLDDETSENIRKKIMAYSLSEADSDYYDPSKIAADDFQIDTAMTDAMDTSTETESTIVSAAAKIQAGARGFLTRRRLRRASAGTKSSTQDTKASFGNDAISESLERFIEEEAAKKIQLAYRLHNKKQKKQKQANVIKSASLESSLAAKRQTLQRGDALQKDSNSTPEDENIETKTVNTISVQQNERRVQKKSNMSLKWPPRRQNSMPVQIECEVLRVIPKHKRKRIKSAEIAKNKLSK